MARHRKPWAGNGPRTLVIDIGGSHIKGAVLSPTGKLLTDRIKIDTPRPCPPRVLVAALTGMANGMPPFDRLTVGFPGVVHHGRIYTAPAFGGAIYRRFDLATVLERRLAKPVRVLNDADVHGRGVIRGKGVEVVVTLGTGFGSALFLDGHIGPRLQLAPHPGHDGRAPFEFGNAARKAVGRKRWSRRVAEAIEYLRELTDLDHLYIGGGNARRLDLDALGTRDDITIIENEAGLVGGVRVWDDDPE